MRRSLLLAAALAGLILADAAASAATVPEQGGRDPEAMAADSMGVSLTQAIATAEQHSGGKAYDAGLDADKGSTIVVETNGPKGVRTVTVDAKSGRIVGEHQGGEPD